jgi:2-desacetyl-2-hydroxyethyl bacteriochlorophyllide A dehydrogenase
VRAVVTEDARRMAVRDVPPPGEPGPGEVLVRPEAVGLCGSDFHFFAGELSARAGGAFPRVQGHEVAGVIEAAGPDSGRQAGERVALLPLSACGECYACRIGRPNVCPRFRLIGIHVDGGLQELLRVPAAQAFPIAAGASAVLTEPVSIAIQAVTRGRVGAEPVVILGAGPIGQATAVAALDRGARVLLIDRLESRLGLGLADGLAWSDDVVHDAVEWAGGEGPPVVIDATGAPEAIRAGIEMVCSAGRFVQVGMSGHDVSLRIGSFTEKELDVLGVSCCGSGEFAQAVDLVEREGERLARLISHEFELERAPEALAYAMENPTEVMKVVVRGL